MLANINGLKIAYILHPLPTLPPQEGGPIISPLPWRERARVRGIIHFYIIMRVLITGVV
jgi:hypothetical protein